MNRRVRKRPEGSITTDEKERNTYLLMKYKERVDWMVQNNQVEKSGLCDYQIVCDGLTENETVFGMKRLTVGVVRAGEEQSSLFVSSVEYHLENPLWKHVVVHLHKGEYEARTLLMKRLRLMMKEIRLKALQNNIYCFGML